MLLFSQYIAIIGSGYIGLEFSDVYTVSEHGEKHSFKLNTDFS